MGSEMMVSSKNQFMEALLLQASLVMVLILPLKYIVQIDDSDVGAGFLIPVTPSGDLGLPIMTRLCQ